MVAAVVLLAFVARPALLHVEGTKVLDADGTEIRFHGINVCSLEWAVAGEHVAQSVEVALDKWGANLIRLPLSEDRWFGRAPDSKDDGSAYRALVDATVAQVAARSKYVLLDLHWSNAGVWGQNIGQHDLADMGTLAFWKSCAPRYANQPAVLFDLYNEPIRPNWKLWRDGGEETETIDGKKITYAVAGMQTMLDAIRASGAKNLVIAGGLGYASRMDGYPEYCLTDKTGQGVVYANHFYPGWESVPSWEERVMKASKFLPIIVSEFGGDAQTVPLDDPQRRVAQVLAVLKKHDWNWCAWCMHPAASPCLIADWSYTPTTYFGTLVQAALKGESVPIPPQRTVADDKIVFDDELRNGFQTWSSAKVDLKAGTSHTGKMAIQVDAAAGQQLQLGTVPFCGVPYSGISLWLNGGEAGGQRLLLTANVMDVGQTPVELPTLKAGEWVHVVVTFKDLGIADKEDVKSFALRSATGEALPTYFVDDISIVGRLIPG